MRLDLVDGPRMVLRGGGAIMAESGSAGAGGRWLFKDGGAIKAANGSSPVSGDDLGAAALDMDMSVGGASGI